MLPYGLWWVAAGYVARSYLMLPLQIVLLRSVAGITARQTAAAIAQPLAAAILMGVAVSILVRTGWADGPYSLAAVILFGAAFYIAVLAMIARDIRAWFAAQLARLTARS